jgi:hypothetical protein
MPFSEGQKMRYKPVLTPTMCLPSVTLWSVHQPLSLGKLVESTGAAPSIGLLSSRKLLNNWFIITITITVDGITHYEISGAMPTAAVRK